ncbi:MAG: hypothetical protein C4320_05145 [Armatimonadota bacterium]
MKTFDLDQSATRRAVLVGLGAGAATTVLAGPRSLIIAAAAPSDGDILTFALNLEYLEAEYYCRAVSGNYLEKKDTQGVGRDGRTTGGAKVPFENQELAKLAREIAQDELDHVRFLRNALGKGAVAKPSIDLDALKLGYANDMEFITLARAFEDVGVSAYRGAAKLISNNDYLDAAAAILATEAYHAGALRAHAVYAGVNGPKLDAKDQPPTATNWIPTDRNGLAIGRTPAEVGAIVRGPSGNGGAFFPSGLNGNIR